MLFLMVLIKGSATLEGPSAVNMSTIGSSPLTTSSACRPMFCVTLWSSSWCALLSELGQAGLLPPPRPVMRRMMLRHWDSVLLTDHLVPDLHPRCQDHVCFWHQCQDLSFLRYHVQHLPPSGKVVLVPLMQAMGIWLTGTLRSDCMSMGPKRPLRWHLPLWDPRYCKELHFPSEVPATVPALL